VKLSTKRPFSREQRLTIIHGMLIFVLIVVVLQLWLLTATMNAWLSCPSPDGFPGGRIQARCDNRPAERLWRILPPGGSALWSYSLATGPSSRAPSRWAGNCRC
jgi:hypothetical protein